MKDFVFVSDFDGTMTHKDFYSIIIDKYLNEGQKEQLMRDRENRGFIDINFLITVFRSIDRDEDEIVKEILNIPFDDFSKTFIENVKKAGGDFVILSAGTGYYIEKVLHNKEIYDVVIISNKGIYKDRGILMIPDDSGPFYSNIYGIDKEKVVTSFKSMYETIYYAGDSAPDLKASMLADVVFAKGGLQGLLKKRNRKFIAFDSFKQIDSYLFRDKGVNE